MTGCVPWRKWHRTAYDARVEDTKDRWCRPVAEGVGREDATRDGDLNPAAEEMMKPGAATIRANEPLDPLLGGMPRRGVTEIIVTTPEGRILGVVDRI